MDTDRRIDGLISSWMEDTAPTRLPARTLEATFERTRVTRQEVGWRPRLFRPRALRTVLALTGTAAVVVAVAVATTVPLAGSVAALPRTPDAWTRVLVGTPSETGDVVALAATPGGLLAIVGTDAGVRLTTSRDGRDWTLVPADQHPRLSTPWSFGYPSVVGTDRGFLLLQLNEVWMSENGDGWHRLAGETTDPDLHPSGPDAAVVGGPGIVGVGDDKAWYSADGSDWSMASVPALPAKVLERPEAERNVAMTGVTAADGGMVAWGITEVPLGDAPDERLVLPLLWASGDGRTWTDVTDPEMDAVTAVTGGPAGFVATGQVGGAAAIWFSADRQTWERVNDVDLESRWPTGSDGARVNDDAGDIPVELRLRAAASGSDGYVLVGSDGACLGEGFCGSDEAVIWTSADGRSWDRVPRDDRFAGGWAAHAVAWGSRFVVGGTVDGRPAIWISGLGVANSS
jgi:hypothetical protein